MCSKADDEITYPLPNFNALSTEVWERIRIFITHFIMDVITCWNLRKSIANEKGQGVCHNLLTHWGWHKMAAILQTTFAITSSRKKIFSFWLKYHWRLFPRVQLTSYYLNQWLSSLTHIFSLNGLSHWGPNKMACILWTFWNAFSSMKMLVF